MISANSLTSKVLMKLFCRPIVDVGQDINLHAGNLTCKK